MNSRAPRPLCLNPTLPRIGVIVCLMAALCLMALRTTHGQEPQVQPAGDAGRDPELRYRASALTRGLSQVLAALRKKLVSRCKCAWALILSPEQSA